MKNLKEQKKKKIEKANKDRETYNEQRQKVYIKIYKNVKHQDAPKFMYRILDNVHSSKIKRQLKHQIISDDPSNHFPTGDVSNHNGTN